MSLVRSLLAPTRMRAQGTPWSGGSWDDLARWLTVNGLPLLNQTWASNEEKIEGSFSGLVAGAYQSNSIVFACLMKRFMLFSQARFQFQQLRGGQPGDLFGTPDLQILERPEPGETTADLLTMARLDADLAGDWFGVRRPGRIKRLRPDWTTIMVGSARPGAEVPAWDPDAEVAGFSFDPLGAGSGDHWSFERGEVAHFAPIRDPLVKYRGIPLPTAALRDIRGDSAMTSHKLAFMEHAATPNLIVKYPPTMSKEKAQESIDLFEQEHAGAFNAYRTMYLLGGVEAQVVGKDLQQLEFSATQGKGETRIVAAMGLHPTIVPVSEGLQGSSLNAGNFGAARRLVADTFLRPDWGSFAGSLEVIVPPLPGSRLWYDDRHVPFLAEDVKDAVDALFVQAQAMRQLGDGGWDHDAVVDAVTSGDLRRLSGQHTGLVPVQLQAPGSAMPGAMAARRDFWPVSGDWTGESVSRGELFAPDHPIVAAFPSLFESADSADAYAVRQRPVPMQLVAAMAPDNAAGEQMLEILARIESRVAQSQPAPAITAHIHTPDVRVTSPDVIFGRGAIEVSSPVTVTTPDVHVTTPPVTIERGAVEVSSPVTVTTPDVHVTTPDVHVTTPPVTVERGAVQISAPVTVTTPDVHVTTPPVNVTSPEVHVAAPEVSVAPAEVHVTTPATVIEEGAVQVHLTTPEPKTLHKRVVRNAKNQITEIVEEPTDG